MVLKDVRNELVSERSAREDYGVVLAGKPLSVDEAATRAVREKLRHARNWSHEPMISWSRPSSRWPRNKRMTGRSLQPSPLKRGEGAAFIPLARASGERKGPIAIAIGG